VDGPSDPLVFLVMVLIVSLSGVIMPGPLFATTVAKGYQDAKAGLKISVGHAIIELPLILAIFLGAETVLRDKLVFAAIGLVGGAFLLYTAISMFRTKLEESEVGSKSGALVAGLTLTAVNPYFILWWATVGASLVAIAAGFGLIMIPIFAAVHLTCDFAWLGFVSFSVHRSKGFLSGERYRWLFMGCGAFLVFFALYFMVSSVQSLL
jgi:threonine/homoserine/homoserine lactone efflux protein